MYLFSKPFPEYRWRWATLTPSESLNIPEINYGCLKVLASFEGERLNSPEIFASLLELDKDIQKYNLSVISLARDPERNLFRNSGQYWKNTGLLRETEHGIVLSDFGRSYSNGEITKDEFSAYIIKNMKLPNQWIEPEEYIEAWADKQLVIKPLEMILSIVCSLYRIDLDAGYITSGELVDFVIPMAGNKFDVSSIADAIVNNRVSNNLAAESWKATENVNDIRMAKEFLIFLNNYGYLKSRTSRNSSPVNRNQEYYLTSWEYDLVCELLSISDFDSENQSYQALIRTVSEASNDISRRRVLTEILFRPKQTIFRRELMQAYDKKCLISDAAVSEVLQACHIVPVKHNGSDSIDNGMILRSDLHLLYDSGHLRIESDGKIELSDYLKNDPFYSATIPEYISLPPFVNIENIRIRNLYNM